MPTLQNSQSVVGTSESIHEMLTPDITPASMNRSASATEPGAFASIRDGIAGLGIGERVGGVLGSFGGSTAGSSSKLTAAESVQQEEMR
jgi:hypothetical protein